MFYEIIVNLAIISISMAWYYPYIPNVYTGNTGHEYPVDYDPDGGDPEQISFDGIYERRKNFDVETPMEYPLESSPEEPVPTNGDILHSYNSDHNSDHQHDDGMQSSDEDNGNSADMADDEPSESQSKSKLLSDGCLRCLCEASSECDPQVRCHVEGPTDYRCGPFQIDVNYWNDAGNPGADQNNPMDFEDCMNDIECSIDTVNGYMKKWSKDCDGDGKVSCDDYAKMHKGGKYDCNSSWILSTPYWNKYKDCYFEYR